MIPIPNLNDQELNDIVENAIDKIKSINDGWNPMTINDPGIFLIELLATIKNKQQQDIDFIGERNFYKFVKLLGIDLERAKCSETDAEIIVDDDTFIPKGFKFKAEDVVFETTEPKNIFKNKIKYLGRASGDRLDLFEYNRNDLTRKIKIFSQKNYKEKYFFIGFENELRENRFDLFFEVYEDVARNPIKNKDEFIGFCKNQWQYYGEENGVTGWHDIEIEKDETLEFLYSGYVSFKIKGKTVLLEAVENKNAHFIRVKNITYGYETAPLLSYVIFNSVRLVQKDTLCESVVFKLKDFNENQMNVFSFLAYDETYRLFIRSGSGYVSAESIGIEYILRKNDDGSFRFGTSHRNKLRSLFEGLSDEDDVFMLILYKNKFFKYNVLGSSRGCANQEFGMKDYRNACYEDFEIMVSCRDVWRKWQKTNDFESCKAEDEVYIFNPGECSVLFGDNEFGKVPSVGEDNIIISSFSVSLFDGGNLKSFTVESADNIEIINNAEIFHFREAVGGRRDRNSDEVIQKVRREFNSVERAVTVQDYEKIVKQTQGLKIKNVDVIPLYKPGEKNSCENTITVIFEPYYFTKNKNIINGYINNIKGNIDKAKLITTKVFVTVPEYVPMDIYAGIKINNTYKNAEKIINDAINQFIEDLQNNKFGCTVFYADIYNVLECLECIEEIKNLQIDIPADKTFKNSFGDIKILQHGRIFLRKFNLVRI